MKAEYRRWPWLFLIVLVVALDWLSKQWVLVYTNVGHMAVHVTSFLNLRVAYNRGMAFGFLSQHTGWQLVFLSFVAAAAVVLLLIWLFVAKRPTRLFLAALPLVIGGAIGNALDRILHLSVTDFLDFHALGWHFWTFNVADTAITVGVVFLLLDWVLEKSDRA